MSKNEPNLLYTRKNAIYSKKCSLKEISDVSNNLQDNFFFNYY